MFHGGSSFTCISSEETKLVHCLCSLLILCMLDNFSCMSGNLFDLILNIPSTIFQLNRDGSSWVEPVLSKYKCVLLKDHNPVTLVRLEPAASLS